MLSKLQNFEGCELKLVWLHGMRGKWKMVGEARRHNWPFPLRARFETLRQLSKNEIAANVPTLWCVAGNDFGASFVFTIHK